MRAVSFGLLVLLSVGVCGYAAYTYGFRPLGDGVHPDMKTTFVANRGAMYAHIFGAMVALALGPFQFLPSLRAARPRLHRSLGRLYLGVGVLVGGGAGLYISYFAFGGPVSQVGFGALAALWLSTGGRALWAVRNRDFAAHRRWMVRNFALTFSAVTFRLWMPGLVFGGLGFAVGYPAATWACWVPNLLIAEWLVRRSHHSEKPPSTTSVAPLT